MRLARKAKKARTEQVKQSGGRWSTIATSLMHASATWMDAKSAFRSLAVCKSWNADMMHTGLWRALFLRDFSDVKIADYNKQFAQEMCDARISIESTTEVVAVGSADIRQQFALATRRLSFLQQLKVLNERRSLVTADDMKEMRSASGQLLGWTIELPNVPGVGITASISARKQLSPSEKLERMVQRSMQRSMRGWRGKVLIPRRHDSWQMAFVGGLSLVPTGGQGNMATVTIELKHWGFDASPERNDSVRNAMISADTKKNLTLYVHFHEVGPLALMRYPCCTCALESKQWIAYDMVQEDKNAYKMI